MFSGYVEGTPVVVETNEDGLRSGHSRRAFLAHGVRVAVLGDSFTFGAGVDAADAFPARLERRLRARPGTADAAVLNAGVISYSPFLERAPSTTWYARTGPRWCSCSSTSPTSATTSSTREAEARTAASRWRAARVSTATAPFISWPGRSSPGSVRGFVPVRLLAGRPATPAGDYYSIPSCSRTEENRYFIYRHPLEQTAPFFQATLANVRAIAASARQAGAPFVLVVAPRYHHWNSAECPQNWERGAYRGDEPYQYEYFRFFAATAPTAGFPVLDLLPAFQATGNSAGVPQRPALERARARVRGRVEEYLVGRALVPEKGGAAVRVSCERGTHRARGVGPMKLQSRTSGRWLGVAWRRR
jgi:lysophospholipase L1-like esterase